MRKSRSTLLVVVLTAIMAASIGAGIAAVILTRSIQTTVTIQPAYGLSVSTTTMDIGILTHNQEWQSPAFTITNDGEALYQISWSISDVTGGTVGDMRAALGYQIWINPGSGWMEWFDGAGNPIIRDLAVGGSVQAQVRCSVNPTAPFQSYAFKLNILAQTA